MSLEYEIVNDEWVHLIAGPYEGRTFKFGRVQLIDEGEHLRVRFDYEMEGKVPNDTPFIQYIGPILVELIDKGLMQNNLVFRGGT